MGDLTSMLILPDPIWMVSFYVNSSQITFPSVMAAGTQVELSDRILVHSGDNKMLLNISHNWSLDCLIALLFLSFPFFFLFVVCFFLSFPLYLLSLLSFSLLSEETRDTEGWKHHDLFILDVYSNVVCHS